MANEENFALTSSIRTLFEANIDIPYDQAKELVYNNGGVITIGMQLVDSVLICHFNSYANDPDVCFDGQYRDLSIKVINSLNGYPLRMQAVLPLQVNLTNMMQEGDLVPYRIRFVFRGYNFKALAQPDSESVATQEFQWWVTEVLHVKRGRLTQPIDLCCSTLSSGPLTRSGRRRGRHLTTNSSYDPLLITKTAISVKASVIRSLVLKGSGNIRVAFRRNADGFDVLSHDGTNAQAESAFRDLYPTVASDVITIDDDNSDSGLSTSNPRTWFILTGNLYGPNHFHEVVDKQGIASINYTISHTGNGFRVCKIVLDSDDITKNFVSSLTSTHEDKKPPKQSMLRLRTTNMHSCRNHPTGLYKNISVKNYCDDMNGNDMAAMVILDEASGKLRKTFPSPSSSLRCSSWSPIPLVDLVSDDESPDNNM